MATKKSSKTKKKKPSKLLTQAKKLGKDKYAGVLAELDSARSGNRKGYQAGSSQRVASVDREIGSINAAGATTTKSLDSNAALISLAYKKALEDTTARDTSRNAAIQQGNSNLLSSLQSEAAGRGIDTSFGQTGNPALVEGMNNQSTLLAAQQSSNAAALERQGLSAGSAIEMLKAQAAMVGTSAASGARSKANAEITDMYNTYLKEKSRLSGEQAKTKLDQGSYTNETYLTLKDKAAAAKADAAARAWDKKMAMAQLGMESSRLNADIAYKDKKLASDSAYRDTKLKVDTQVKYDRMSDDSTYKNNLLKIKKLLAKSTVSKSASDSARKQLELLEKMRHNKATEKNKKAGKTAAGGIIDFLNGLKGGS